MANLKPLLDAARTADADVAKLRDSILQMVEAGDEASLKAANDLRPALDKAKIKADEANALYTSVRDASLVADAAGPLMATPADPAKNSETNATVVMNRAAFAALEPNAQMSFMKDGGKVVEEA
jgi:hypothetical protein